MSFRTVSEEKVALDTLANTNNNTDLDPHIFRAYDIRGVVDTQLNSHTIRTIGRSLASLYPEVKQVAVGCDGRLSSHSLSQALCEALCASGVQVLDVGEVPTPVLYYAASEHCQGSGLMITGSHNPPEYNGIKMVMGGHTLAGDDVQAIYKHACRGDFISGDSAYQAADMSAEYLSKVCESVSLARPLKVAIDCGNGVAGPSALALLKALGCQTQGLYCDIDGHFPNHHPNPSVPENLTELIDIVRSGGFDLGLAFDGDGDRLGVVDNQGQVIWADRQMMIYARSILTQYPGASIVYDVKSSFHLPRVIEQYGGKPRMSRTGHSYIKAMLKESGALLAGEMSGHIFFNDRWYGFDDALYTAARLLEIIAADSKTSHEVFAALPVSYSTPEITIDFEREGMQHDFIKRFVKSARFEGGQENTMDGLRVDFADGWGLVRASNTTPCLVLRFEGDSTQSLARIQSAFRDQLVQLDPDFPFPQ